MPPTVRTAGVQDLPETSELHAELLPHGFFVRLGTGFLGWYHASFASSPAATLLVAEQHGRITGFLAGTIRNADHYRFVLRRRPVGLATSAATALLRDAQLAGDFARTRGGRYLRGAARRLAPRPRATHQVDAAMSASPAGGDGLTPEARRGPIAVLTHVAVDGDVAEGGTGRALVERFVADARGAGAREVRLITMADGGAAGFYRRLGWHSRGRRAAADGADVEEFWLPL